MGELGSIPLEPGDGRTASSRRSPGDFDDTIVLNQYRLYVDTAERVSDRRATVNRFYVTIQTSLLAALAIVGGYKLFTQEPAQAAQVTTFLDQVQTPVVLIAAVLGIALCLIWRNNLKAFSTLNTAKFAIILEMEKSLPFQPFGREWDKLKALKYPPLTKVEAVVPVLCLLVYVALLVVYVIVTFHISAPLPRFG